MPHGGVMIHTMAMIRTGIIIIIIIPLHFTADFILDRIMDITILIGGMVDIMALIPGQAR